MIYLSYKEKLASKIFIIILFLFKLCYNDSKCQAFLDLNYPKGLTLENGYQLLVTNKGIYSFYPGLSSIKYYYNFTEEQKITFNLYTMPDSVNQIEISQFSGEDGGKRYVICLAKDFLYFMDEKGKIMHNEYIPDITAEHCLKLIAYKYYENDYYFIIAYNYFSNEENRNALALKYYKITKNSNKEYEIILINFYHYVPKENFEINLSSLSCEIMKSNSTEKLLTCFESMNGIIFAFSFNPDNNFAMPQFNIYEKGDDNNAKFIKSSVNKENTKSLVCYSIQIETSYKVKCIYYDSTSNGFEITSLGIDICNENYFAFNNYYFPQTDEYIMTCVTSDNKAFIFGRINNNFQTIGSSVLNSDSFSSCY